MRPARALIDLAALRANLARAITLAGPASVTAVVKANGYGHGAARLLPALDAAPRLAVACIEEALSLREAGAGQPILLLEGVFEESELSSCVTQDFEIVVHEPGQARMLETASLAKPLRTWLKIDSGMGRLGFRPETARHHHERLSRCTSVAGIGLMTHLASADEAAGRARTREQLHRFDAETSGLPGPRSICNSAGLLAWPHAHGDMVRPGIMLYGISPLENRAGHDEGLAPVMTLTTRLIAVKDVRPGETVGYGATWTAPARTRIGIAAIGYGDGYPRHAPSGTPVLVRGRRAKLAGRVSMDMIALDLGGIDDAAVGDPVVLWGRGLAIEEVAALARTIAYELLCGVTGRVHVEVSDRIV